MARSADARRLRGIAILCVAIVAVAVAFGVGHNLVAGAWVAVGAVMASLVSAAAIWRLAAVAQEWRKELRATRAELAHKGAALTDAVLNEQTLMESIGDALLVCDVNGSVVDANVQARRMFDFPEPIGRSILAISLSHDLHNLALKAAKGSEAAIEEIGMSYPTPRLVVARAWMPAGSERVYVSLRDDTELRRLEKVRTDFVANVSHELRTPMAGLRAMAETLCDDPHMPVAKLKRYTGKMIEEVDRLTSISEDLLTLSLAESKPVERESVDLSGLLSDCLEQIEGRAREQGLELRTRIQPGLMVGGDRNQLVQVFSNLLTNALRYTPNGWISVLATRRGDQTVVEVADTGIGIASEHLPRVFERFYRVDRARSRDTGGTGLGLSIVRHIVESHGGTVEVESELNVGSVFRVRFPNNCD